MIIGLASLVSPAILAAQLLVVAQQDAAPTEATDAHDDNHWRLNLDLYGFAPLSADTDVTLDGNSDTLSWDLRDVLDHLTGLMTVRAGLEKGRWGLQTALNYSRFAGDFGSSSWTSLDRSRNRQLTGDEVADSSPCEGISTAILNWSRRWSTSLFATEPELCNGPACSLARRRCRFCRCADRGRNHQR